MNKRLLKGFTLIELMITVIILSVIIGIAYPSYQKYTTRTRRADAQIELTTTAHRLEKYFSVCSTYPLAGAAGLMNPWPGNGVNQCPPDDSTQGLGLADLNSPDGHYTIVLTTTQDAVGNACAAAGTCFTVTATPKGGGLQVGNGALRIDSAGRRLWDRDDNAGYCCSWSDK
ncbi:MAG: type IV pilin protein [Acidiferrobacterales bacterium]